MEHPGSGLSVVLLYFLLPAAVGLGAYPVYQLVKRRLGPEAALALAAGYLLDASVVFTVLYDFHPEKRLEQLRHERQILYESDGFLIFGPVARGTIP
jgi:hypothetical protein